MTPRTGLATCSALCIVAGLSLLAQLGCANSYQARVSGLAGSFGGVLIRGDQLLTAAHCEQPNAMATCAWGSSLVSSWLVHPEYHGYTAHDLSIARLAEPLLCDTVDRVSFASVPGRLTWRGADTLVSWTDGQQFVADAKPSRFCMGSSGEPLLTSRGELAGLVSRWPSPDSDGCSRYVRAVAAGPNHDWMRSTTGAP